MEGITSPPILQSGTNNSFFSPLLISMLGILVTSMAIIAYHFLLVKYCIRSHASSTTTAAQPTIAPRPPTGVDEKVLKTIPILAFSAVKRDQLEECVVCLGELEDEDIVRLLPNCKHAFHVACIDQWFAAHTSCPLCRSPIHEQTIAAQSLDRNPAADSDHRRGNVDGEQPSRSEGSFGLLRHFAPLVLPAAPTERRSWSRLMRSQSVDLSIVVVNQQRNECSGDSSSSSSAARGRLTRSGSCSMRYLDRVSSKWLRSFSRLRTGKGSNDAILPY